MGVAEIHQAGAILVTSDYHGGVDLTGIEEDRDDVEEALLLLLGEGCSVGHR
jgi:hypothetical protein